MRKRIKKIVSFVLVVVLIGGFVYLNDAYKETSMEYPAEVHMRYENKTYILEHRSEEVQLNVGIVFYQGGKVEEKAYVELLAPLAAAGYTVYIPSMPFNLAVFNSNRVSEIMDAYTHDTWYLGGHSLGGAMAANAVLKHENISGLILLASYASNDIRSYEGLVMSIYGTQDQVLNLEKYEASKVNLPNHYLEIVLDGGNHAQFGSYGSQKGDGEATLSGADQQSLTIEYILNIIEGT